MNIKQITADYAVSPQIALEDVATLAAQGFKAIVCNRPDGEEPGQLSADAVKAEAEAHGLVFMHIPVKSGAVTQADAASMAGALASLPKPVLAYCRSGARSSQLWDMIQASKPNTQSDSFDIVIIGGGAAGLATAASILKRAPRTQVAIIDPAEKHYYQPGWTMVGAGVFKRETTMREQARLIPKRAHWIKAAVATVQPEADSVTLADGRTIRYRVLVACPGLKLDWAAIPGLAETIGKNGVTSNYGYDLAPYTNELVQHLGRGRALFTQPPMPIKCAGAPQKAMYLSCDIWRKRGVLGKLDVQFHNAAGVLFGVAAYVPALMKYIERYGIKLNFESKLVAIDGPRKVATFEQKRGDAVERVEESFDMIHVVPPQTAPDFIKASPLAAASGWIEVDEATLQHKRFSNIFGLGDACSASNAKTAAAARAQAPVVATNALAVLAGGAPTHGYDGYGSCPLTVERGKIVLAEFGYGGKLLPSFPKWFIDGQKPQRLSWLLKSEGLPWIYWNAMLKGREWMTGEHGQPLAKAA